MIQTSRRYLRRFLIGSAALILGGTASAETMRLRADNWMPFNGDPKAELPGYVVEIAKAIFEPQGITIDYQTMPWAEALKAAREGEIEGVIGASVKEAQGLQMPVFPIGSPRVGLFMRKGSPFKFEHIKSLETVRIGVIKDYTYWEAMDDYIKANAAPKVVVFEGENALKDAITQLTNGGIEVYPEVLAVFSWYIKSNHLVRDDYVAVYLHEGEDIFIAFSKKTENGAKYATLFDEGIRKLRKSGELTRILEKYGQKDWQ